MSLTHASDRIQPHGASLSDGVQLSAGLRCPRVLVLVKKIENQSVYLSQDDDIPSVKMFLYLDQDIHR